MVGVGSQELWRRFCAALERPELADDPRFATGEDRLRHRGELDAFLAAVFAARPAAHWDAALRAHRVPGGPPATVGEAVERARGRGQVVDLPAGAYGSLPTIASPFLFDGERAAPQPRPRPSASTPPRCCARPG